MNIRKLNEKLNQARRWCNNCEGAVLFLHEPKTDYFALTKVEPKEWIYIISYKSGELLIETKQEKNSNAENIQKKESKSKKTVVPEL